MRHFIVKHNLQGILIGLIVFLVISFLSTFVYYFEEFELKMLDFRFQFRGEVKPNKDIVVVAIDEKSINEFGRWPWRRIYHKNLVDILHREGAKIIFFDIFFLEKGRDYPQDDMNLADTIRKAGNVFFDYPFLQGEESKTISLPSHIIDKNSRKKSDFPSIHFIEEKNVIFPLPEITSVAKGIGCANIYDDTDHIFRNIALFVKHKDRVYPFSSFVLALEHYKIDLKNVSYKDGYLLLNREIKIPITKECKMLINYCGGARTFSYISYSDVINKKFPKNKFKNKIVLIGGTATGLFDIRPTPFGQMPGIEMIANSLNTIIEKKFIKQASASLNIFIIFLLCMLCGAITFRFSIAKANLSIFLVFVFYTALCIYLFEKGGILLNMFSPLISILLTYLSVIIYRYLTAEKEKKKIKNAFQHYVSASVVADVLKNLDNLKLGGEKKVLTVLFSDIRGFTAISEKLPPEEVVSILNEYFTEMTDVIFKYQGTLDKFIGDAIMVIFGAPVYFPDHALRSVLCAIEIRDKMKELQQRWESQNRISFSAGIGINTGEMVVGNMGSRDRWDYTVIGDAVNLASRLEGKTRDFDVDIIISESTYEEVKDKIKVEKLGEIVVKGREKPVKIYEVIGRLES